MNTEYSSGEITQLSVKSIEIYQIQGQLVDRLWAYFSQYCALLILVALAAVAFRETSVVQHMPLLLVIFVGLAFLIFAAGNHHALSLTIDELFIFRNMAALQTRLNLRGIDKASTLLFHVFLTIMSLGIYIGAWLYAR